MRRARLAPLLLALALAMAPACSLTVKKQRVPSRALASRPEDFAAPAGVVVMHYYGAGGWGIKWRGQYLLLAPYFSNHDAPTLISGERIAPKGDAIRAGLAGTPVGDTTLILVGHGHVDHAGDIGGLFDTGAIAAGRAALVADRSTTNELGAYLPRFSCVKPLDIADQAKPVADCVPSAFRIVPLHSAHAPHLELFKVDFEVFGGRQKTVRADPPHTGGDFHLGYPWAFVIDLLDEAGEPAFRIHYMDAAAGPPHGLLPGTPLSGRDVDVHIACVPGFNYVDEYPDEVLRWGNVRYVLAAHWEDFFRPWTGELAPVPIVLDEKKLNQFVDRVEHELGAGPRGVAPLGPAPVPGAAGPRGATWALPVPGETLWFKAGPQPPAPAVRAD
jgi:hypothetical protein